MTSPGTQRRSFLAFDAIAALTVSRAAWAQSARRLIRLAWLTTGSGQQDRLRLAFVAGMRELGYVEGRNLRIEGRAADNDFSRLLALAAELLALRTSIASVRLDTLIVALDPVFFSLRNILIETSARHRLPAVYPLPSYSEDGGLLSYGFNLSDSFKRAASFVDRILKGAKPGDLPVERPLKFELLVNLKTARALSLAIPQPVLLRADREIE